MGDQWHYNRGGKQAGPVSAAALKQLACSGQLSPADHVWKEGIPNWVRAETIKGLFDAAPIMMTEVIPVEDPGQVFSERLAKVKKQRDKVVQGATAQGAKDAEEAFPHIVKEIERCATSGEFWCLGSDCGIDRREWTDDLVAYYCKGYQDRFAQLLNNSNNSNFTVEITIKEAACAMSIKW
jgi:hypothetical protein